MATIFFDSEFTGLHKNTSLISIGLIADTGQKFYAEITDYDKSQVNDWLQANVIDNLWIKDGRFSWDYPDYYYCGDFKNIREKLKKWLEQFESIEWVSDVCHYDFVLLIDLVYGHALNMPYGKHNAACHDINQDIARYYDISEIEAFDKSREEILEEHGVSIEGNKHNALYDAEVIKCLYEIVNNDEIEVPKEPREKVNCKNKAKIKSVIREKKWKIKK